MIFVNSMSDLFHKQIPFEFVDRVFDVMEAASWHTFQVLTKRSPRMRDYIRRRYGHCGAPVHVWLGVSVENNAGMSRILHLIQTPVQVRFLSIEPLLGPIGSLPLDGIGWVIVGGESAPMRGPWRRNGPGRFAINAWLNPFRSSSSNGAVCGRNLQVAYSTEPSGRNGRSADSRQRNWQRR